jgi:CubicO group peptidase (beta-lactamase class C family)
MTRSAFTLVALLAFLVAPLSALALPAAAPEEVGLSSERLNRLGPALERHIAAGQFPGAVVVIARKGRLAHFGTVGRLAPDGAPMPKDAIFRLYSMTKPFTSVAAAMLIEEGRLRLADPVGRHLPQLEKLEVAVEKVDASGKKEYAHVPAQRPVTVYELLRHTSGIVYGGFTPNAHIKDLYAKGNVGWAGMTPAEQLERLAKVPLAHQPGTTWEYGLGTDVLGRVVEAVSGTTLGRFFDERIFRPLKMTDTAFHLTGDRTKRLAQPFATDRATGRPIKLHDVTVAPKNDAGGAGTAGTALDYARFGQMLLNGGQLEGVRLLGRGTVRHMTSDHLGDMKAVGSLAGSGYGFGLGFAVRRADGLSVAPGSAGEFNWGGAAGTAFWVDPKEQLVVVLMVQMQPGVVTREVRETLRNIVYQAIVD